METFLAVLLMLGLIAASNVVNRFIPFVPVPLIQIGLGVIAALVPTGIHMHFEPELFFVLFIAPLLFNDGKRTPRGELWNLRAPILLLALGLVFVTVVVAGYAINWMIPSIPLAAAFALAAILSPTDAVAVSSLAGRVHLPGSIHRILEGESLMNDASGLVAFKFAIAAAVTGVFSLPKAGLSFIIIAAGGLLVGAVLSFLLIRLSVFLRRFGMEDVTMHVLLQILTPFIIYLISEELGVSGILAVVAGGVVYAIEKDRAASPQYKLQLVSASTWSVLLFVLNGLVFVILGVSVPDVVGVIYRDETVSNFMVFGYVLIITALLILLRFIWVYLYSLIESQRFKERRTPLKSLVITSISGVRGAVTLAGAFSIPLALGDGSPFPERDLIIALAAGVILMSLVIASILLPLLAGKAEDTVIQTAGGSTELAARSVVIDAGMSMLRSLVSETGERMNQPALLEFTDKIDRICALRQDNDPAAERKRRLGVEARLSGLEAERTELRRMTENGTIPAPVAVKMEEMLEHTESILCQRFDTHVKFSLTELQRLFSGLFTGRLGGAEGRQAIQNAEEARKAKIAMCQAAVSAVSSGINDENREAAQRVIDKYERIESRLEQGEGWSQDGIIDDQKLELKLKAIQEQRDTVQQMYQNGAINLKIAGRLRRFVDQLETSIWED
ncbi:sodium:proton symporter [Paenibacillus sp. FSL R7-0273]|uniref:Na+/H+ antiporter n=1 Tax=Paenibacillus sp. FSL R7-0273 TaxID=1536772 RepID=UPI0004F6C026|nr:Na+/H+ antiporter [Paenibacillus sp. FSL R7-0273]AIQ46713.1 sodium:proton symporter [Paenibacillus sp. FSL R7-0273]OMF97813.1 Na+/H+ antiporter [Paenibacillus sp. FSL R7-0273]